MTPTTRAPAEAPLNLAGQLQPAWRALTAEIGALAARRRVTAFAVGGCVRDWLLGRPVTELDIAVEGDAPALAKAFAAKHKGALTVHPQFQTATVEFTEAQPAQRVDFAGCRKEAYSEPAAYPKVSPGTLQTDLVRRDFTINAMAMPLSVKMFGQVVDLFGGARDAHAGLIRVLHAESFRDDPSRMLRAIRFATRLQFTIEEQTARWMREAIQADLLACLNRGRLRKELLAMLEEPDPLACLRLLGQWLLGARLR